VPAFEKNLWSPSLILLGPDRGNRSSELSFDIEKKADGSELEFTHGGSWMVRQSGQTGHRLVLVAWARIFQADAVTGRMIKG
jgi:hypothetical protein